MKSAASAPSILTVDTESFRFGFLVYFYNVPPRICEDDIINLLESASSSPEFDSNSRLRVIVCASFRGHHTPAMPPPPTIPASQPVEKKDKDGKEKVPNNVVAIGPPILENAKTFDPLRSIQWHDYYWNYVDNFFQPLNMDDIRAFRSIPPSTNAKDDAVSSPFSLTQRLVAALLDDGTNVPNTTTVPPSAIRAGAAGAVATGTSKERMRHQNLMETRVRHELATVGLIDGTPEDDLTRANRATVWRLREVKALNAARHRSLARTVTVAELRDQAERREKKRKDDNEEIAYLKIRLGLLKKSRKNRANVLEILSHKFGHYDHVESTIGNKSKKRKSSSTKKGESNPKSKSESPILIRGYSK